MAIYRDTPPPTGEEFGRLAARVHFLERQVRELTKRLGADETTDEGAEPDQAEAIPPNEAM